MYSVYTVYICLMVLLFALQLKMIWKKHTHIYRNGYISHASMLLLINPGGWCNLKIVKKKRRNTIVKNILFVVASFSSFQWFLVVWQFDVCLLICCLSSCVRWLVEACAHAFAENDSKEKANYKPVRVIILMI